MINKEPQSLYKIRFSDCDMYGHLNNARYLDYLINAREDHLKEHYQFDFMEYYQQDLAWVVSSHEIAYIHSAVYNEMVTIQSTLLSADSDLLHIETIMMNEKQDHIKAVMRSKLIPIHIKTGKKQQHSAEFMSWVAAIVNPVAAEQATLQDSIRQLLLTCKERKANNQLS